MKLGLISSAWLGTPVDTARSIELTKEIGFDTIDIFADPLEIDARERRLIRKTAQANQLPVVATVCCALGIADFNKPVREFHVRRAKSYLDFCYELEGRNLLLVLGEYIWQQEVIAPADQWKWAVEHTRELAEYAASLGTRVVLMSGSSRVLEAPEKFPWPVVAKPFRIDRVIATVRSALGHTHPP